MKILFLDIDGVLNTLEGTVNPDLVLILKRILQETGAKVVLSSSWRRNLPSRELIRQQVCEFIDCTPILNLPNKGNDPTEWRGYEIQNWLEETEEQIDGYAILDDTALFLLEQESNLFRTLGSVGLTEEIADAVIKHLNVVYLFPRILNRY